MTEQRVLVVDDVDLSARTVASLLEAAGFVVRWTRDLQDAIAVASSWRPATVFVDRWLGRTDGLASVDTLRRVLGATARLVILSGDEEPDKLPNGIDAWVRKPSSAATLLAAMGATS